MSRHLCCWLAVGVITLLAVDCPGQTTTGMPVYIEDSPAAQELVEAARQYREQDRLTDAAAAYQQVIEQFPQKLMEVEQQLYVDSVLWVRSRLLADPQLLELYRAMYEPAAQRELEAAHTTTMTLPALESIVQRYALTHSGMAAALDLSAMYLERADAGSAASVLAEFERHPDVDAHASRYHTLGATAALLTGDELRLQMHLDELRNIGDDDAADQLDEMSRQMGPVVRRRTDSATATPTRDQLPVSVESALWEKSLLDEPLAEQVSSQPRRRPSLTTDRQRSLAILPVADRERLYLNVGEGVVVLDRSSGRELWAYEDETAADQLAERMNYRGMLPAPDRRGVLVQEDGAFAVMGEALFWARNVQPQSTTALVKLDKATGEQVWRLTPGDLDASLSRSYFQGTPLPGFGVVYVALRRAQMSGFQDVFIAAIDADDGRLIWRRHVSSTITQNRYATGPPTLMTQRGSMLYVADNMGAAAAIDTRSGNARWVRVLAENQAALERVTPGSGYGRAAGGLEASPPVLVDAGLIVPSYSDSAKLTLLDPETGRRIRELDDEPWSSVRMVAPAGNAVLALGNETTLYDGATLEPKWSVKIGQNRLNTARGWPTVNGPFVVVPADEQMLVLNLDDGTTLMQVDTTSTGNPLMLDGQIVLATPSQVLSFMEWPLAYSRLSRQVKRSPADAEPGLALAHLAVNASQPNAVLEGIEYALTAIEHPDSVADAQANAEMRQQVVDTMLSLINRAQPMGTELQQKLFDRLAQVTGTPAQEVAYHFALGGFLERTGRPTSAIEHYQSVLASDALSAQLHRSVLETRRAGLEAQQRLRSLVEREGQQVYQKYDLIAEDELAQLKSASAPPEQLVGLIERYPVAACAPLALSRAAEVLAEQGQPEQAARQYQRAYRRAQDDPTRAAIIGALTELFEQQERYRQASRLLKSVQRDHPAIRPIRAGREVDITLWLADLELVQTDERFAPPKLNLPLMSLTRVDGRLLPPHIERTRHGRRFLTIHNGQLRMYDADGGTIWQQPWQFGDDVELIDQTAEQVLLWSPATAMVAALDADTGEQLWDTIDGRAVLTQVGDIEQREAARPPAQRQFLRQIDAGNNVRIQARFTVSGAALGPPFLLDANDTVICLGDRSGRVITIDRDTGQAIWQLMCEMDELSQIAIGEDSVLFSGASGVGTDSFGGAVMAVDLLSGEARGPVREESSSAKWIGFGGFGLVISVGEDYVAAHRVHDGRIAWRVSVPGVVGVTSDIPQAWADDQIVLARVGQGIILVLDAETGQSLQRVSMENIRRPEPMRAQLVDQAWHVLSPLSAARLSSRGQVLWRDGIEPPGRKHILDQRLSQQHVILIGQVDPSAQGDEMLDPMAAMNRLVLDPQGEAAAGGGLRYMIYTLDRETGLLEGQTPFGTLPNQAILPGRAMLLDNHLVYGTNDGTYLIAGAEGR